jgi:hypothetical protein
MLTKRVTRVKGVSRDITSTAAMRLVCGLAALLTVCWALLMYKLLSYPLSNNFHHHIDSPILAIELASDQSEVEAVLQKNSAAIATLRLNTKLDLVFIPLYAGYWFLAGRLFGVRLAVILPLAIVMGLADYLEDYFIFQSLNLVTPPHQFVPSLIKWIALGIAFAVVGVAMLRNVTPIFPSAILKILGVAHLAAAVLMLVGAGLGQTIGWGYAPIKYANIIFGLTMAVNAIGLLGTSVSRFLRSS